MTIKQLGGIFGRNPTFSDVNATDITTTNLDATNLDATDIDVTNIDTGTLHVATNIELTPASSTFGTAPAITHYTNGYLYITGSSGGLILRDDGGAVGIQIQNDDYIKFDTGNPATEAARFNSSGNLAFPSGQGIDFSATAGTGTSELFDDYEEGTFTYTLPCSTSGSYNVRSGYTTGYYTKIGRVVSITLRFESQGSSSPVGNLQLAGLPFTTASSPALGTAQTFIPLLVRGTTGTIASFYFTFGGGVTTGTFAKQGTDGAYSTLSVSDIPANVEGSLSFTYETA